MPTSHLLDFDALLAPVPGDHPAGSSVPFGVRERLEEHRKEIDPDAYAPGDPRRPEAFQKANWPAIGRLARETLAGTSKDLPVAARLAEALAREHGFAGLRDGLQLLRLMVGECWDRLHPPLEGEEDLEVRAAPFIWLDDTERGARFPTALRLLPMISGKGGRYGWLQWKQSQDGQGGTSANDFEQAIREAPRESCEALVADLTGSWEELDALALELNAKMGRYAPGLSGLRQAVGDCLTLAQRILQRKGPAPAPTNGAAAETDGESMHVARQVSTRAQVYQQLAEAAAVLQQLEPQSPIPYMVRRAIELGSLPFPELMRTWIRDAGVLRTMSRELGIEESFEEQ